MARLARLLNSNSTRLWTGSWLLSCFTLLLNSFSLFSRTPSHCSLEPLLTVLSSCFSLFCWTPSHCSLELLLTVLSSCFSLFCWTPSQCSLELLLNVLSNSFSLFSRAASHSSLELLLPVLSNSFSLFSRTVSHCSVLWAPGSGLKCSRVDLKEITDYRCWSVIVDSLPRKRKVTLNTCQCLVTSKHVTVLVDPFSKRNGKQTVLADLTKHTGLCMAWYITRRQA
jgi:hypothetical protein